MSLRLNHYFRTYRLRSGLSQKDLAFLIACRNDVYISRLERGKRPPTLVAVLAYMILFETPPADVVPNMWDELEAGILARAEQLYYDLQGKPTPAMRAKLDTLERILDRNEHTRL